MIDETSPKDDATDAAIKDAAAVDAAKKDAAKDASAQDGAGAGVAAEAGGIDSLRADNAELKEQLLRLLAEMDNLRKRTEKEKHDASRYAINRFAHDLLSVGDNLARALSSYDAEARKAASESGKNLIEGVEMTERELTNVLARHGIEKLEPEGQKFDPHFHQAVFEVDRPDMPAGLVVDVAQPGYTIGERVLRPAMVGVSRGGAKIEAGAASAPQKEPPRPEPAAAPAGEAGPARAKKPAATDKAGSGSGPNAKMGGKIDRSA